MKWVRGLVTHFIQNAMQSVVCKNGSYLMYYSLFLVAKVQWKPTMDQMSSVSFDILNHTDHFSIERRFIE